MIIRQQIRFAVFGSVVLHLLFAFGITTMLAYKRSLPPSNDDFKNALDLGSGYNLSSFSDFTYASREIGEPVHGGASIGGSVWWKWNAQEECEVELNVNSIDFEDVVGVYRGSMMETLVKVASRKEVDNKSLVFFAEPGTLYHFVVASAQPGMEGSVELQMDVSGEEEEELIVLLPEMFIRDDPDDLEREKEYIRTESNSPSTIAPPNTNLESDRNTLAASDSQPSNEGEDTVPNIDGRDLPFGDLAKKDYVDGEEEDANFLPILPQWAPKKQISINSNSEKKNDESKNERDEAEEIEQNEPDGLFSKTLAEEQEFEEQDLIESELNKKNSVNNSDPTEFQKNKEPEVIAEDAQESLVAEPLNPSNQLNERVPVHEKQKKAFQVHSPKKKSIGKLSNLGEAALDVEETVLGHYKKKVDLAVQKSWHRARTAHADFVKFGSLKVRFWVNEKGDIVDIRLLRNDADPVMVDFSISGILRADIPPVPKDLIELTQDGRMEFEYEIIIY